MEEILQSTRAGRLFCLEIIFNDDDEFDVKPWQGDSGFQDVQGKACRWFTTYRSFKQSFLPREFLPSDSGKIDQRKYRAFAEARHLVFRQD